MTPGAPVAVAVVVAVVVAVAVGSAVATVVAVGAGGGGALSAGLSCTTTQPMMPVTMTKEQNRSGFAFMKGGPRSAPKRVRRTAA